MDPQPETLIVRAEMVELARVSSWASEVAERLTLPRSTLFAIDLCFEEALSNIIRYGFPDQPETPGVCKDVRLAIARGTIAVTVTIEDHGLAFDPREVAAPAPPRTIGEATIGGLGIHLMRQFARDIAYQRLDGMNRLTLRFDIA